MKYTLRVSSKLNLQHKPSFMLAKRSFNWWSTSGPKAKLFTKMILKDKKRKNHQQEETVILPSLNATVSHSSEGVTPTHPSMQARVHRGVDAMVLHLVLAILSFHSSDRKSPRSSWKTTRGSMWRYTTQTHQPMYEEWRTEAELTVYSPCFFPYHFIHFLNSLSILYNTVILWTKQPTSSFGKANKHYRCRYQMLWMIFKVTSA